MAALVRGAPVIRRHTALLALILLVPAMAAAKCQPVAGGGSPKACDLRERQPPRWVAGPGKGSVQASVHAVCDTAPKRHTLTVWLEYEGSDGKTFQQVGKAAIWDRPKDVPPPPPGRDYPIALAPCIDGNWRVRARAEGTSSGGVPFDFVLPVDEVHISVIRCRLQ
jgi:hypothetical protein